MILPADQTVLITGASSGIGAAIAHRFASEGYSLLLFGRNETRLRQVQSICQKSSKVEILLFDLAAFSKNSDTIESTLTGLPTPTILINNAGIFQRSSLEKTTDADWMLQFQINLLSAVQLTRLIWPRFIENKKGSVVNIASTLGLKTSANTGAYGAVKAAMINWTQSLAQEGGPHNIRANCICPGIVDTPIHDFHSLPPDSKTAVTTEFVKFQLLSHIGEPNDVAEATYFLASDLSKWTTGSVLSVDGGINIK